MKLITWNGVITTISSKRDRSLGLRVETPELTAQERAEFIEYQGINAEFTLKPLDEDGGEVLNIETKMEGKTPSQRLRGVLFILWKKKGEKGLFENFYRSSMEAAIERVKLAIDEEL